MQLREIRGIETESGLITLHDFDSIRKLSVYVFTPFRNEHVVRFVNNPDVFYILPEEAYQDEFYLAILKRKFNALKPCDDLLFFDKNKILLASVPYRLVTLTESLDHLDSLMANLRDKANQEAFVQLINYDITKDLRYLDKIIKNSIDISMEVFSLLDLASQNTEIQNMCFDKIFMLLNIQETPQPPVNDKGVLDGHLRAISIEAKSLLANGAGKVKESCGKKNLIIFHLESISTEIYCNNKHNLPALADLMSASVQFNRFYTSASSSIMSLFDLFYGNEFEIDSYSRYGDIVHADPVSMHLYEILRQSGYEVLGIGYNDAPAGEEVNRTKLWNVEGNEYQWIEDFEKFLSAVTEYIAEACKKNKPFALHIWDLLTHSGHFTEETEKTYTYDRKSDLSIASVNLMIQTTVNYLKANGLLDDTIILCYGDHGDDMWTRDMNYGFTHVTAPYANLVWTPMSIYDSRLGSFSCENLASMVDLKETLLFLLGIEDPDKFPYGGINLFEHENEFVYSRSLLHNQREHEILKHPAVIRLNGYKNSEHKNKAYTIIGKRYNLMAGKDGLELFSHRMEPWNYNNLLDFINFDENFCPVSFKNHGAWRGHFRKILLRDSAVFDILWNLDVLKKKLTEHLMLKDSFIRNEVVNPPDKGMLKRSKKGRFE